MGTCVTDIKKVDLIDEKQVFPPKKALFNNPFFPKHLYEKKAKKKKWLIFIICQSFFLNLINFIIDPNIFAFLLNFSDDNTANLCSTTNMCSSTWTCIGVKRNNSNKSYFELLRDYLQINCFIVAVYLVIGLYLFTYDSFQVIVYLLHCLLWILCLSFVLYVWGI